MPVYVPPFDARERHLPGYNFCGPGTDVTRRLLEGVEPMNELDAACLIHDLETEPRGPFRSRGNKAAIMQADMELKRRAEQIARRTTGRYQAEALSVVVAMHGNLLRASRGGPFPL
jgi:hypothetical protein